MPINEKNLKLIIKIPIKNNLRYRMLQINEINIRINDKK
jgi:hypothetical protein